MEVFDMKIAKLAFLISCALLVGVINDANPSESIMFENDASALFENNPTGEYIGQEQEKVYSAIAIPNTVILNFKLDEGTYDDKCFYIWTDGVNGTEYEKTGVNDFGMYIEFKPRQMGWPQHDRFYFIIKTRNTWVGQSLDTLVKYEDFSIVDGVMNLYSVYGSRNTVEVYGSPEETVFDKIESAQFVDWKTVQVKGTGPIRSYKLYALDSKYYSLSASNRELYRHQYEIGRGEGDNVSNSIEIKFPYTMPTNVVYEIEVQFTNYEKSRTSSIGWEKLYDDQRFETYYTYSGNDLGAVYSKEKTSFKLWAPTAARVELRIYSVGNSNHYSSIDVDMAAYEYQVYRMSYMPGGVYSAIVDGDLHGKYYTYYVYNSAGANEVVDPYAKATGVNGERGMILDFDTTDPDGWDEIPQVWDGVEGYDIKHPTDLSVYEIHIRDLTMDDTWNGTSTPGTFQAFYESGTTYSENGITVKTGFDHIEELGVNAIQILPVFDHSNDEINMSFNWGYNPLNYNVVEGGYSSDPYHGEVRVKEFKQLIQAYANNDNHTRVIMDVVYNHVASVTQSIFTKIMPYYYFRTDENGFYTDGAGCGNEVKSEATMMSKYIVDSVKWWASEYKIKGFRFDLMGLLDVDTMRKVKDELYKIDPDIVCYGEGWSLGYSGPADNGAWTSNVYSKLYPTTDSPGILGGFSDGGRNAMRGGNDQGYGTNNPYPGWGFMAQGATDVGDKGQKVGDMIRGMHSGVGANPYQTVNYVSCHDNYTLWDQLNYTLADDPGENPPASKEPNPEVVAAASVAAHAAVAMSLGISFIQGGEELFRTKIEDDPDVIPYPDLPSWVDDDLTAPKCGPAVRMFDKVITHNSYMSSDECNSFKWDRKISIEYQGEKIDMLEYSKEFANIFKIRNEMMETRCGYDDNVTKTSTWGNGENDSTYNATVIGVWFGTATTTYWLFLSGRVGGTISWDEAGTKTLYYNTKGEDNGIFIGDGKITLGPGQFVIFKS